MEKVKLEKRRLAEEAHRKEQEAAAAKKRAEKEAAEQAEAAAKQKALEDAEKARAGLESAKKLEGLTGQALADAVAKLPDKPNADAFATARFAKHGSDVAWLKTDAPALKVVAPSTGGAGLFVVSDAAPPRVSRVPEGRERQGSDPAGLQVPVPLRGL